MTPTERLNRLRFAWSVRNIDRTPPVRCVAEGPTVLSMVQHRDAHAYLLALKSFLRFVRAKRVVVVADPTLNEGDRRMFKAHVPDIEFRDVAEFRRPGIPVGGCWERLCAVSEYVADNYVVQLDADTVAVGRMDEVAAAIRDGSAFTLSTADGQRIGSCAAISEWARTQLSGDDHVQLIAESLLDGIEGAGDYRYARGCAGFAGYPRGSFNFETMRLISERMGKVMPRWNEWGTEQFTSNLIVASIPGARLLPHPKYCAPHYRKSDTVFFHFIGYVRFTTPLYARLARNVALELRQAT